MSYTQRLSPDRPGCIVFLLDRSYSMNEPAAGRPGESKAEVLARSVNNVLYDLVLRSVANRAEGPRHLYDVALVGYGLDVGPAWSGPLTGRGLVSIGELARQSARVEARESAAGNTKKLPVWVEPVADGATPLCGAMNHAGQLIASWVGEHPDSFPPVVINVGDGAATDGDAAVWARRLRSLGTDDGPTLVLNVNVTARIGDPVVFPASDASLTDEFARAMFSMSSELPDFMQRAANEHGYEVESGARGMVFHADAATLMTCLRVGIAPPAGAPASSGAVS